MPLQHLLAEGWQAVLGEAAHVCMQAWRGYRTEKDARMAFIAAAQAADVLIGGHRSSASTALASEV